MQIISELEGYRRGPYAGVVGYHSRASALDTCIATPHAAPARRRRLPPGGRRARRRLRPGGRAPGVPEQARRRRAGDRAGGGPLMALLLIDNYDSFTYNLAHLFGELGAEVVVRRNDEITVAEAESLEPSHLVISPGPGRPESAGVSEAMVRAFAGRRAGARRLPRAPGDRVRVRRRGRRRRTRSCTARRRRCATTAGASSRGCRRTFAAGRYHSLAATSIPEWLEVSATGRPTAR